MRLAMIGALSGRGRRSALSPTKIFAAVSTNQSIFDPSL